MKEFTHRVNASLPLDQPDDVQLALIQSHSDEVCGACSVGQSLSASGRCVGLPITAQALAQKEVLPWRTKPLSSAPAAQPLFKPVLTNVVSTEPLPGRMGIGGPIPMTFDDAEPSAPPRTETAALDPNAVAVKPPVVTAAPKAELRSSNSYRQRARLGHGDGPPQRARRIEGGTANERCGGQSDEQVADRLLSLQPASKRTSVNQIEWFYASRFFGKILESSPAARGPLLLTHLRLRAPLLMQSTISFGVSASCFLESRKITSASFGAFCFGSGDCADALATSHSRAKARTASRMCIGTSALNGCRQRVTDSISRLNFETDKGTKAPPARMLLLGPNLKNESNYPAPATLVSTVEQEGGSERSFE